jgi:hypothetical protein
LLLATAVAGPGVRPVNVAAAEILAPAPPVFGPPLDNNLWWNGFDRVAGFDGAIVRLLHVGSDLIVTGEFTRVGATSVRRIARWDGVAWHPLAAGLDAVPRSMTVYQGRLVAGDQHRVRSWDGTSWVDLGAGSSTADIVRRLAVHDGRLFASFHHSGLRAYDGSSWTTIAVPGPNSVVLALATYQGDLYAGGNFQSLEGAGSRYIARWDGTVWHAVGAGTDGRVEQFALDGDLLLVGGSFNSIEGRPIANLAGWNGVEWSTTAAGYFADLFEDSGNWIGVKAHSGGRVYRLTPNGWQHQAPVGIPQLVRVHTGIVHQNEMHLSAAISSPIDGLFHHLFRIPAVPGTSSFPISPIVAGEGLDGPVTLLTPRSNGIVAGGSFHSAGDEIGDGFQLFDGTDWRAFAPYPPAQFPGTSIHAVLDFEGELIAGGRFPLGMKAIGRWTGAQWQTLGEGLAPAPNRGSVATVRSLAIHDGALIAGGLFERSGETPMRNIARWDGAAWQPLGDGLPANQNGVLALTTWAGRLVATSRVHQTSGLVAVWDGMQWTQLGNTWEAQDIETLNGQLYASFLRYRGGTFRLARWNHSDWIEVPSPSDVGTKLFRYGNRLVQGNWTWNGAHWARLGLGIEGSIAAMAEFQGNLYCGGNFRRAGGRASYYIARYDGALLPKTSVATPHERVASQTACLRARELANGTVAIDWDGARDGLIEVFDVRGRRVGRFSLPASSHRGTIEWDRRAPDGVALSRGVYVLTLRAGDVFRSHKLVLLRAP